MTHLINCCKVIERAVVLSYQHLKKMLGCTRVQSVSLVAGALTTDVRVRFQASRFGVCGEQSGSGRGLSPSTSVFPCYHFAGGPCTFTYRRRCVVFAVHTAVKQHRSQVQP